VARILTVASSFRTDGCPTFGFQGWVVGMLGLWNEKCCIWSPGMLNLTYFQNSRWQKTGERQVCPQVYLPVNLPVRQAAVSWGDTFGLPLVAQLD